MGFFGTIGKLFKGEPVFSVQNKQQPGQPQAQQGAPGAVPQSQAPVSGGPKVIPQVIIERWQCVPQGAGLHCELLIRNYSQGGATLQRIEVLGIRDELGHRMDPGETYEFEFQLPARPNNTNLNMCDLYFRDDTGDYFLAKHQVEFEKQPDGTFSVLRFRLLPPIRDV